MQFAAWAGTLITQPAITVIQASLLTSSSQVARAVARMSFGLGHVPEANPVKILSSVSRTVPDGANQRRLTENWL